jgi:putative Mg2+ transporter-C (MgtC) family protein
MLGMPLNIGWNEIALRLVLTIIAGLVLGYDRTEQGKAAGLRTTMLVGLAASVAMIQVNLLLPTAGRAANSFVMNDLMRLPLGILTGVGFIGGGAILRRGDIIVGVTTAATLWCITVIGLCIGGGQIALGLVATAIGFVALWGLQWVETQLRRKRRARLRIEFEAGATDADAIRRRLVATGWHIEDVRVTFMDRGATRSLVFDLSEFSLPGEASILPECEALACEPGVIRLDWHRH